MNRTRKFIAGAAAVLLPLYVMASWLNTISVNLSGGGTSAVWNIFNLIF